MDVRIRSIQNLFCNDKVVLALLWLIVTAINLTKAFHIDDTFHLEAGEWIMNNWTKPLSGYINWNNNSEVMHSFNQPVLFFYLVAIVGSLFSFGEVPMHLLLSVFSFLSIWYFYKIQRLVYPKGSLLPVALFALCPAFIVNQNVMTDVPLLAFILGFTFFLFKAADGSLRNYIYAGAFLALSLLTKYTVLPLLLVYALVFVVRKHFKYLLFLAIPLGTLALWSFWNLLEFDGIHILGRTASTFSLKSFGSGLLSFVGCLAAVFPIYFLYLAYFPKKIRALLMFCSFLVMGFLPLSYYVGWLSFGTTLGVLNISFTLLGLFILIHLLYLGWVNYKESSRLLTYLGSTRGIALISFLGIGMFVILFAPFMASRHVLLTIPFLILIYTPKLQSSPRFIKTFVLCVTGFLGVFLGFSDLNFARYYKDISQKVPTSTETSKVWSVGHWGWQWYTIKNGAHLYNRDLHQVKEGDRLAMPLKISAQEIHPSLILTAVDSLYEPTDALSFFSVQNYGSMYTSRYKKPAWTFSTNPIDTVVIYRVDKIDFLRADKGQGALE
jgi:hypothetical protein